MSQAPDLPDTSSWQPRDSARETLQSALQKRCEMIERRIKVRALEEKAMNIDNFDSGRGLEDIIREEFESILPDRYKVTRGVVVDSKGMTSGDVDLAIFNSSWFPEIKAGATKASSRTFLPIEGIYAVAEIKQSINYKSFDEAMEKLVKTHRLHRPATRMNRLVENRESSSCTHGLSNPLYSFILATSIDPSIPFTKLVNRFFDINKELRREEVVRAICVVGEGTATWGYMDPKTHHIKPALFMREDLYVPIMPLLSRPPKVVAPLESLFKDLMRHLFHSVLAPEDIEVAYGEQESTIETPNSDQIRLIPDKERVESLQNVCPQNGCPTM